MIRKTSTAIVLTAAFSLLSLVVTHCGGGSNGNTGGTLDPQQYVLVEAGTLPVVLSAPHGGPLTVPGIPERTHGTTTTDMHTLELIQAIQQRLQYITGAKANVVAAKVSRKYVDFNRTAIEAYESPAIAPLYQAYHGALRSAVDTIHSQNRAILVDLHGQGLVPTIVYRGTRYGTTANLPLLCENGAFLERLNTGGVDLSPSTSSTLENPSFSGGYIVATYGKTNADGINAVQLEFGYSYRDTPDHLNETADKVASAIAAHLIAIP